MDLDNDSLQITKPKRGRAKTMVEPDPVPEPTPIVESSILPEKRKPREKKQLDSAYLENLKKGRELRLLKKAQERLAKEEASIASKTDELRKSKEQQVLIEPEIVKPVVEAPPAVVKQPPVRKPRVAKPKAEPVVVEKIVERIVYEAPKLNFCFV
jgi:hypothetical protein